MKMPAALIASFLFLGGAVSIAAQAPPEQALQKNVPFFEYDETEIGVTLERLAKDLDLKIQVDPDVQGKVNLSLSKVSGRTVLECLLRMVGATYRIEGDTLQVFLRSIDEVPAELVGALTPPTELAVDEADLSLENLQQAMREVFYPQRNVGPSQIPAFVQLLKLSGLRMRLSQGSLSLYRPAEGEERPLSEESGDLRDALWILFGNRGIPFTLSRDVGGSVMLPGNDVPFEGALQSILRQANATCRIESGVFHIFPRAPETIGEEQVGYVSLQCLNLNLNDALGFLFGPSKQPYIIHPSLKGEVTLDLRNVPMAVALKRVLEEVGGTARFERGVYIIEPATTRKPETPPAEFTRLVTALTVQNLDVRDVLRQLFKPYPTLYWVSPEVKGTVSLDLRNVSLEVAFLIVLGQVGARYTLEAGVLTIVPDPRAPVKSESHE